MTRILLAMLALLAFSIPALAEEIEVAKSPTCGCCTAWVDHLRQHGFSPTTREVGYDVLLQMKRAAGLADDLQSCHTATIGGYVIEGHVPAADIRRLLAERPDAIGLSVPGMPIGSPGMEDGDSREAFEVLLVRRDGSTEVFASY